MALYHPDADTSAVQGVISVRSSMPVGDPSSYDDQLITVDGYAEMKSNNHIFHPEMRTQNAVIIEIFKGHPFLLALSEAFLVPLIYVQQFWKHIQYVPAVRNLVSRIDHFTITFGVNKLTELLAFPQANAR